LKSVDAPKISVLRSDNVTQAIELNEDTSLRKGRDRDHHGRRAGGDHLIARGALQDNVFVPKFVWLLSPEQWKRMQKWAASPGNPVTFGLAALRRNPRAASLKSLAPALVFLLFISSVDLLRAQDPAPSQNPVPAGAR